MKRPQSKGIPLKKHYGQYFLRDGLVISEMLSPISIKGKSVFEIGCGDGFLTREILAHDPERLWVFEIDEAWAEKVDKEFESNQKLTMHHANFLDIDFSVFEENKPWILLSNLPYHITFPILKKVQANRECMPEGVVMMQEEVAQKIIKKGGRGYGYISLFFQHYFEWKLLAKIPPTAFYPQPKVFSRLIHFVARKDVIPIPNEEGFWKFIKLCLCQPRRTLRNNLGQTHFDLSKAEKYLALRAQQMSFQDFLELWKVFDQ